MVVIIIVVIIMSSESLPTMASKAELCIYIPHDLFSLG